MPAGAPGLKLQLLAAKKSRDAGLLTDAMRSPPLLTSRLQGEQWKRTTVRTALAFPGFVSAIFLTLNFLVRVAVGRCTLRVCQARLAQRTHCSWRHVLCGGSKLCRQRSKTAGCTQPIGHSSPHPAPALLQVWGQRSSGAVPFGTLCALVFLWCGVSVPLCFVGSYFGYKKPAPEVRGAVGQGWTLWLQAAACMGLLLRRTSSSPSTGCGMQDPPHSPSVLTNRPAPATPSPTSPPHPPSPHSRTRCAPTRSRARCRSSRGTCTPPSPSLLAASCPLAR